MKNLSDTIKKLPRNQLEEIAIDLEIKEKSGNYFELVYNNLISYTGIAHIIDRLPMEEKKILLSIYQEKNGITFEELGKRHNLDTGRVEKNIKNLSKKLLVYVLKNRQKISNKLDKVFLNSEIRNLLNPLDADFISSHFKEINRILEIKDLTKYANFIQTIKKNSSYKIIESIFNSGGLILLEELKNIVLKTSYHKILSNLIQDKFIHIFNDLSITGKTIIILDKKAFIALVTDTENQKKINLNIHNRYNLLLNLLRAYDTISTYGLFLTKQNLFRKIDKKHLEESMINITDLNGIQFSQIILSQLSLYLLYIQNCIQITNDIIIISLKNIKHLLADPIEWLLNIVKLFDNALKDEVLFKTPFQLPNYSFFLLIIDLLYRYNKNTYKYLESAFLSQCFSQLSSEQINSIIEQRQNYKNIFHVCIRFFCISGIIEIGHNIIKLSDIGYLVAEKEILKNQRIEKIANEKKNNKTIYLNPDFTMIVPKKELPSDALYHILTHTEIITDDVILNTRISRESILTSLKRGMDNVKFLSTLDRYLKNEIPNNLNFLISEWMNQTINVKIFNAVILKTNPSFIDKISHSKIKNSIINRLAAQYAIINRKYADKIIKMAKENDAVINLFDEDTYD